MRVRRTGSSGARGLTPVAYARPRPEPPLARHGIGTKSAQTRASLLGSVDREGGGRGPTQGWGCGSRPVLMGQVRGPGLSLGERSLLLPQSEDGAGDDEPLDLARALVDLGDLRVALVPLDGELLRVAVPAEDLDRLAGLAARHL